jgi:predicted TIM-barrel fold metal-dependent hydrolase
MENLKFFDCNCSFGMRGVVDPGSFYKVEDLVKRMESYGIEKALVYHSMAREYSPKEGNRMLIEEIKPYKQLIPLWTIMPHHTGEFPTPSELIKEMKENEIKAATMFPAASEQGFSLANWNCGELLSALEKHRIPLIIAMDQFASWNEIYDFCSSYHGLSVVLTNVTYRIDRNLYPILKKLDNIYIETSGYKAHNGIEEICAAFGAKRLIFGSGMPVFSGSAAVSVLNYARISNKEKQSIAFENLNNILGGVAL